MGTSARITSKKRPRCYGDATSSSVASSRLLLVLYYCDYRHALLSLALFFVVVGVVRLRDAVLGIKAG